MKRFLFGILLVVLVLPAIQTKFPIFEMGSLGGYAERAPHPEFNYADILNNSYQPALEKYVEDRIGFREALIRLRNQLGYSLFGVSKANGVLVGKDNMLFEDGGIYGYLGKDFRSADVARMNVRKFKLVQDTLAKRGILLVFAIAPDKANFFSENIPDYYRKQPRSQTNYSVYAQEMERKGVNMVDLAKLFKQWKDTARYPLFPRGGIHWSGYGITLAADTLFRYIEQRGHFDLPNYSITSHTVTDKLRESDNDVAKSLNLIWEPTPFQMAYPEIKFEKPTPTQQKPKAIVVGDSFTWGFFSFYPFMSNLFDSKIQFWYYNTQVQIGGRDDMPPSREVRLLNFEAEVLAQDVILILFNQHNMDSFDHGFSITAYDLFFPLTDVDKKNIESIKQKLSQDPKVQDKIWKQANTTNQDYNQLLYGMAVEEYELHRQ
ncbi:hypothetical protein MTX78_21460 [Hymenobacter tibetensis]|uniref:AlgX/AlgJ SGNH hydrolase-like domain-containing protein n=1 Tax=Hymenobacter tibetensis TaxID=497967 RepID=A0ABY4CWN2_9BACT|nr:hypothetical protein [Hymenobacter tibetensis]UOG74673.1 hypothetical protein MTX78_21460 [Hymenobacter tibetensis]